ncbi:dermonecrotic toxin domain-containing protein [Pseudomonas syringae]|uniref:Uncharacterized protein n=1 Tax=Pseudomonas syringae TaxID=317 RepID=A0A085VQL9_PSESX|nr:DUF6543 domain-containing protein [Pseudomonas syringae]KFE57732.1 hypothetical protein IV01_02705 [Pseudomonas syringae]
MTDLSILNHIKASAASSSTEVIATALGQLGEVFTQWHEHTRTAPSLRQVGHDLLTLLLPESSVVKNPDVLFINTPSDDGSLARSLSLTDALLQTLTHGLAEFESGIVRVYSRHDSLDEQHHVSALEGELVLEVLGNALEALPRYYKDRMDAFWSESLPLDGQEGESQTRDNACVTLHRAILTREMELLSLNRQIGEEDKTTLMESFRGSNLYRISLRSGTGSGVVTTAFVIPRAPQTRSPLTLANCEGNVFLVSAAYGIELYESLADLDQRLRARLSDAHEQSYFLEDLLLEEHAALCAEEGAVIEPFYSYFGDNLMQYRMVALRRKQIKDLDFLLEAAQQSRQLPSDLLLVTDALSQLTYLDSAQRRHFHRMFSLVRQRAMPHWFNDASADDQAFYRRLAASYQKHADQAAGLMEGLESIRIYALDKINAYVLKHLGYRIDPEQIFISIVDEVVLSETIEEPFTYRKSLLDFVVEGLPVVLEETIFTLEVPVQYQNAALDFPFVEKMIAELDVQQHFELDTERRLYTEQTIRAIAHQRDSAIALSAWTAQLKGHLREDQSQELIHKIRGDHQEPGTEFSMGGLAILGSRHVMKDVLVFRMKRDNATYYVLYAPGAPGDRDMFEFNSWQRLSIEVGGWVAKPEGAKYVIDQVPMKSRAAVASLIRSTVLKPSEWSESTAVFRPMAPLSYESNLIIQVRAKVAQDLSETFIDNANQDLSQTYSQRRVLALCEARAEALDERFTRDVDMRPYRDFIREECMQRITEYLQAQGHIQRIDPDTVLFDLNRKEDERNPYAGPYREPLTLTELLMNDYLQETALKVHSRADEIVNWGLDIVPFWSALSLIRDIVEALSSPLSAPVIYSSIGQDLSALPLSFFRELVAVPLGEKYIALLEQRLSEPDAELHLYRRAILASRTFYQAHRDALREHLRGGLDSQQYDVVARGLSNLDQSRRRPAGAENISIYVLALNHRIIEGAMIFTDLTNNPDSRLVYTPNAPDGVLFRRADAIISSMKNPGMPAYYYSRASYKDQRVVGTLVLNLEQDPERFAHTLTTAVRPDHRITRLEQLYVAMIERMIEDVDQQTVSPDEAAAQSAYNAIKWAALILSLAFPVVGLVALAVELTHNFIRGYLAYLDGDRATAELFIFASIVSVSLKGLVASPLGNFGKENGLRFARWAFTNRLPVPII